MQVMKHHKGEEESDKDCMLEFPDKKAQILLGKFTVKNKLKPFCDSIGIERGPSVKRRAGLVDALAKVPNVFENSDEFERQRIFPLRR